MKPQRIQRKRTKGWRMPENTIYVGRPTKFGNPFNWKDGVELGYSEKHAKFLAKAFYRDYLTGKTDYVIYKSPEVRRTFEVMKKHLHELRGKNLSCFCKEGESCHADVLLELANS